MSAGSTSGEALPVDRLTREALETARTSTVIGQTFELLEEATSTSDIAAQRAMAGCAHGHVIVAESQTHGKGRLGRSWVSPPGKNLHLSVVLRPILPVARAPELTLVAGVACSEALRSALHCPAMLKWPNDLHVESKKLGGILNELHATSETEYFVVLGIGLNLNWSIDEIPADLADLATSARIVLGQPVDRLLLCTELLRQIETWLEVHARQGFTSIRVRWAQLSSTPGSPVRVTTARGTIEGTAVGLDSAGSLLVRTAGGTLERVLAGDVEELRAAATTGQE